MIFTHSSLLLLLLLLRRMCRFAAVEDYEPVVPEPVVRHLLQRSGCQPSGPEVARVAALAAQQFAAEILELTKDTRYFRENPRRKKRPKTQDIGSGKTMTLEDLTTSLQKYGIQVEKQPFEVQEAN